MEFVEMRLSELHPYQNNPRKNDEAVEAVAESIRQCGYVAPIIVDEDNIILAGHTRFKALKKLGWKSAQVGIADGLTEEQKRKYRLLDNKTNELALWDFDKLAEELDGLDFDGFDFGFDLGEEENFDENGLDDDRVKDKICLSINFSDVKAYESVKDKIQEIADTVGATMAVKMA